jgi:hypothetical protein
MAAANNPVNDEQATRIWADVVAHDKHKAVSALMSVANLISAEPLTVARFPAIPPATSPSVFKVRVKPWPNAAPTEFDPKLGMATVYLQFAWVPPMRKSAYGEATSGRSEWSPEMKERLMAVQLFHELIHARLILERQNGWPAADKTMHNEFQKWISYTLSPEGAPLVNAFKQQLQDLVGFTSTGQKVDDVFEHLLQEKFATQKAFAAFGVEASNTEIARNYIAKTYSKRGVAESVRALRDKKADAVAAKLVDLYNEIDKFNASTQKAPAQKAPAVPIVPTVPVPAPRKGTELLKQSWKSAFAWASPRNTPIMRTPNTITTRPIPVTTPPHFTRWQPPPVRPTPVSSYTPARPVFNNPYTTPGIPRSISNPGIDPFRGPIRSTASAPPWTTSRPDRFTPGKGSGWDPVHASFGGGRIDPPSVTRMNLMDVRPQPLHQKIIPGFSGSVYPGQWDLGSRDG